jgi:phosphoserine phosphatase
MPTIRLICFDLDQTLINQKGENSWYVLNMFLGITPEEDRAWYQEWKQGRLSYDAWNELLLERYKLHPHANKTDITQLLNSYEYLPGARESVVYAQSHGYVVAIITGSMDIVVNLVAQDLGVLYAKANNEFVFGADARLEAIKTFGDEDHAKADILQGICKELDIQMQECACIGDGANDVEMFRRTGHGITFRGSPIEGDAWKVIDSLKDIATIFP